jgi:hypothetical protein
VGVSFIINGVESNYIELSKIESFEIASGWMRRFCDSYSRIPTLLAVSDIIQRDLFFMLLGEIWTESDNISQYKDVLKDKLVNAKRFHLDLMMDAEEFDKLSKMPQMLEVYRGCYPDNMDGFSWSLDINIAQSFTQIPRYKRDCLPPLLLKGYVNKAEVIFKQNRSESEIIVLHTPESIDLIT